ncbi:MAG TPA: cobalamin-independent methionine synthase II family protein [Stellaceae bacterium]|nr:cobalamin-independent methionine synthase II family protein [Stellaceae bacterium]
MRRSDTRILTSHAGSLPRSDDFIAANAKREKGEIDEPTFQKLLTRGVADVVRQQKEIGIDVPGDGEYGKSMGHRVFFGAWWSYSYQRLGGLDLSPAEPDMPVRRSAPGEIVLTSMADRRDRVRFREAYSDPESGASTGPVVMRRPICVAPIKYVGQALLKADIDNFKAAMTAAGCEEGFMSSIAPGSAARLRNQYYKTNEEFIFACADAMREEYKAIVDAGFILQFDDPSIAENWDQINPEPSVADYKKFTMQRVEGLNHAIKGLPKDRLRFHLCWGSWHGPHTTDIPMADIVDLMLKIDCDSYSFEAANVRHEHEWAVWKDAKLPDHKILVPGIVSHATNVVEHPEVVAARIERFASVVGKERVIAATDCGLGGRVHRQIAWAKLEALVEGAALASKRLWRR